jgi:hypothetical protein
MRPRLAALDPPLKAEARLNASLRRINRDVRFSSDKSPYNPSLHMIFSTGGAFNKDAGMHLEPARRRPGLSLAEGLERYRARLCDPSEAAAFAATRSTAGRRTDGRARPRPKGFAAEGRAADHLPSRRSHLRGEPTPAVLGPDALDWAVDFLRRL